LATSHGLLEPVTTENPHVKNEKVENLEALIQFFQTIIKEKEILRERQFLLYNGKLQVKDHQTKSIEIKISYLKQHNKEYINLLFVIPLKETFLLPLKTTINIRTSY